MRAFVSAVVSGVILLACTESGQPHDDAGASTACINAGSCKPNELCKQTSPDFQGECRACDAVTGSGARAETQGCDDNTDCTSGLVCDHCVCAKQNQTSCTALDIGGHWKQSYVCYSSAGDCCERDDGDEFDIAQSCNALTVTGYLDSMQATLEGNKVSFTGDDQSGTPATDDDYSESGTWTFADKDNLTSSSTFKFKSKAGGGPCVANAKKNGTPTPVVAPPECSGKPTCG